MKSVQTEINDSSSAEEVVRRSNLMTGMAPDKLDKSNVGEVAVILENVGGLLQGPTGVPLSREVRPN